MRIRKKYESGAATNYITRGRALKKLQLSLKDFRRLCILKGIYPREPLHRKKVNKGSTENKIYYYAKDINFLASEPIIDKFREYKIFLRKLTKAKAKREVDRVKGLYERRPQYQLDHIVKERYPTFESALRDISDALCLLFAFAVLPHTKIITSALVASCRRLAAEFNHYIIESMSLNKVFVSIKGIYYEADIMGERITWVVGHDRGIGHITEVDFSVMATFAEFYVALMQFVNFRLYKVFGLCYPPKLVYETKKIEVDGAEEIEKIYSLACPLAKVEDVVDEQDDINAIDDINEEINEKIKKIKDRKNLFVGCRFWLNREVPKDALTVVIRNCGGEVSWNNCPAGAYDEDDKTITHQVIDRTLSDERRNINRVYIQPQWIFDSFNARKRIEVEKYLPGALLPPHLSPFFGDSSSYVTNEACLEKMGMISNGESTSAVINKGAEKMKETKKDGKTKTKVAMSVEKGKMHKENAQKKLNEKGQELKLRETMISKKRKRVYAKIKRGMKKREQEQRTLDEKRQKLLQSSL